MNTARLLILAAAAALLLAGPARAQQTIYVDFGSPGVGYPTELANWNNYNNNTAGYSIVSLVNSNGTPTGISLTCVKAFASNSNTGGTNAPLWDYPATAVRDSQFGARDGWQAGLSETSIIRFASLDPAKKYTFTFFACRNGSTDNRETEYYVAGNNADTLYLNPVWNDANRVTSAEITPTAGGEIDVRMNRGPNNNNVDRFYYIGVLEMLEIPEPAAMAGVALLMALRLRRA